MIVARWFQSAIAVLVDKELGRGCAQGILQVVGEEVDPVKRKQEESSHPFLLNCVLAGLLRDAVFKKPIVPSSSPSPE
jgi:hypothetical protein